ncbi:MAG: hypothetical protein HAW66_07540 [Shewanella sp.]|nr:hypothetical protein [Shewanella sp.]
MKALIQRVISSSVTVEHQIIGSIQHGLVVFLGVERSDDKLQLKFRSSFSTIIMDILP